MIQGELIYPLFDENFIYSRCKTHNVNKDLYLIKLNEFINIKTYVNDIDKITLWFGKDAFCIINLITVLTYLNEINYTKDINVNFVDDATCNIINENIKLEVNNIKDIYTSLINKDLVKCNNDFINEGLKDYLYITSDNNHIIDYIKENKNKLSKQELVVSIMKQTYKYGLSDLFILELINKMEG